MIVDAIYNIKGVTNTLYKWRPSLHGCLMTIIRNRSNIQYICLNFHYLFFAVWRRTLYRDQYTFLFDLSNWVCLMEAYGN